MIEYSLDELYEKFTKHAEEYEQQKIIAREKLGEPPFDDSFNLPAALACIVKHLSKNKS